MKDERQYLDHLLVKTGMRHRKQALRFLYCFIVKLIIMAAKGGQNLGPKITGGAPASNIKYTY